MFRRLHEPTHRAVAFTVDGRAAEAMAGDSVAAALLANGVTQFRLSPVSGAPRGPYCMMGACFECLVTIDGAANRQACLVEIAPAMRVETRKGRREVA